MDIGEVEETLEEMRAEERVTGCVFDYCSSLFLLRIVADTFSSCRTTVGKMKDSELFQIDTKGDEHGQSVH